MSCRANVRQVGDVTVIDLSGRITLGEGSGVVRDTIKEVMGQGHRRILMNLEDVGYIDSAGLGELVGSYASVSHQGGRLKLVHAQSKVGDLLQVTKLYTVFDVYDDEVHAIRSFALGATA